MKPVTYEDLNRNPELLDALVRQARVARSQAVYDLLVAPLARLFARPAALEWRHVQGRPARG